MQQFATLGRPGRTVDPSMCDVLPHPSGRAVKPSDGMQQFATLGRPRRTADPSTCDVPPHASGRAAKSGRRNATSCHTRMAARHAPFRRDATSCHTPAVAPQRRTSGSQHFLTRHERCSDRRGGKYHVLQHRCNRARCRRSLGDATNHTIRASSRQTYSSSGRVSLRGVAYPCKYPNRSSNTDPSR
jgi:hypothetical protein